MIKVSKKQISNIIKTSRKNKFSTSIGQAKTLSYKERLMHFFDLTQAMAELRLAYLKNKHKGIGIKKLLEFTRKTN